MRMLLIKFLLRRIVGKQMIKVVIMRMLRMTLRLRRRVEQQMTIMVIMRMIFYVSVEE